MNNRIKGPRAAGPGVGGGIGHRHGHLYRTKLGLVTVNAIDLSGPPPRSCLALRTIARTRSATLLRVACGLPRPLTAATVRPA